MSPPSFLDKVIAKGIFLLKVYPPTCAVSYLKEDVLKRAVPSSLKHTPMDSEHGFSMRGLDLFSRVVIFL